MDRFNLHQTLFLDFVDKRRDIGPLYIESLDEESCCVILKENTYNYKSISIDNMLLDGTHEVDMIHMKDVPKQGKKTIHIPFVHKNTTKDFIKDVLNDFKWGTIHNIDLVKNIYNSHQKAFVHFEETTEDFQRVFDYLWSKDDAKIKITYNEPFHWFIQKADLKNVDCYSTRYIIHFSDSESDSDSDEE